VKALSRRVPILAYHSITSGPPPLCLPPARFGEHVSSLVDTGWSSLTLDELLAGHARGGWPNRRVMFTFDDGLVSFAREALPRLARVGFTATLFVVAGRIGGETDWPGWPPGTPRERLLDAAALAEIAAAGVEIGAHAVSHRRLSTLGADAAAREVLDGRQRLEDLLSRPVRSFAYPFGEVAPPMAELVRERFEAGFGIRLAYASPRSRLEAFERIDAYYLRSRRSLARLSSWETRAHLAVRSAARAARHACLRHRRPTPY
jgi:peptidoglycan/xylan/chitin deacetylase (PgdA/CDA1 family)